MKNLYFLIIICVIAFSSALISKDINTIETKLEAPHLFSPETYTDIPVIVRFQWYQVPGADSYNLQIAKDMNFKEIITDTILTDELLIDTLQYKSTYYFHVNAIDSVGKSPWTMTLRLITKRMFGSAPGLVYPSDQAIKVPVTGELAWNKIDVCTNYQVQISSKNDFSSLQLDTNVPKNYLAYTGLSKSTYYFWRARALSPIDTSDWSEPRSFRTEYNIPPELPGQVILLSPADNAQYTYYIMSGDIGINGDAFTWKKDTTVVDNYWFEISEDSNFVVSNIDSSGKDTFAKAYSALRIKNLQTGTGYWRVKAGNESGWGPFSEVRRFHMKTVGVDDPVVNIIPAITPNPATEFIIINNSEGKNIEIFNTLGETVFSIDSELQEQRIDIKMLSPGLYFVKSGKVILKFVKV